ncbi:hypothetical protein YC2023_096259 [Brassica napus]
MPGSVKIKRPFGHDQRQERINEKTQSLNPKRLNSQLNMSFPAKERSNSSLCQLGQKPTPFTKFFPHTSVCERDTNRPHPKQK